MEEIDNIIQNDFETASIPLAAFLRTKGFPILSTSWEGDRLNFIFQSEASKFAKDWELNPDKEMELLRTFNDHKERLYAMTKRAKGGSYEFYK